MFDATVLTMYQATLGTIQGVVESLNDLPERRKAVVFVGVGLPVDGAAVTPSAGMSDGTVHEVGAAEDVITQTFDIFRAAQRANVNIYCLDPHGLRFDDARLNREFLQALAENTGGLAMVRTNNPEPGIVQMFRENGSYYLLGYEAPHPTSQGRYRRIDVRVNRPGVTIRSRRGYLEPRPAAPAKARAKPSEAPSPVLDAISSVVPKTDVALSATVAPFAVPGESQATLAIVLQVNLPVPQVATRVVDRVDVQIHAFDMSGKTAGSDAATVGIPIGPGIEGTVTYEVLSQLRLKPGRHHLRLGASSAVQARTGSVYSDVDVPDFSRGRLALSGAVMSATPGAPSGPRDRLASLLPVVPTTQRDFWPGEKAQAFLRVYQPGRDPLRAVIIRARILDGHNGEPFTTSARLDAARFTNARSADYVLTLPLATLPKGEYLLNIEAGSELPSMPGARAVADSPLRRDVRFVMR